MRLVDWAGLYALVGVVCAASLARRTPRPKAHDLALSLLLWPIYVPMLLEARAQPSPRFGPELDELAAAIAAVADASIARLLPTPAQLAALGARIADREARVQALGAVVRRETAPPDEDRSAHAEASRHALARLGELLAEARAEQDELLGLVRRLRVQIAVIGFSGGTADALELAAELAARVDGVDAAFERRPAWKGPTEDGRRNWVALTPALSPRAPAGEGVKDAPITPNQT